ncbi:MAG: C13 family peptidase, partial [Chloroflexota bacterium]
MPGAWKFKAEFPGDNNFRLASTLDFDDTDARLTIKRGAGYAIIVLGRIDPFAEGHAEHAKTTDYIYDTLIERGFAPDDVTYLREYISERGEAPDPAITTAPATRQNLQDAIEVWARDKMSASPAPLYVVLVDHGNPGTFYLDQSATPARETMTPADLNGWLDVLQSGLTGEAAAQDTNVVFGSCYSGSFIPALSGDNRIVITATSADQISYRGVDSDPSDGDSTRDGEFFLMEFFRDLGQGKTLKEAFERASAATLQYTADSTGGSGASARPPQTPLLDDNGDGVGSAGVLTGADGDRAALAVLGLGANPGGALSWFTATPSLPLDGAKALLLPSALFAETTGRAFAGGDVAWLEIKTPAYIDGVAADENHADLQRIAESFGPILPTSSTNIGADKTRFEWSPQSIADAGVAFDIPGTYKAYYFLRDGESGVAAAYLVTNIYVAEAGNTPPDPVALLFPADNAVTATGLFFAWSAADDPDGDRVTYRLEISEDPLFAAMVLVRDGITDTFMQVTSADGLQDLTAYFWRVIPVDEFGASPDDNDVR